MSRSQTAIAESEAAAAAGIGVRRLETVRRMRKRTKISRSSWIKWLLRVSQHHPRRAVPKRDLGFMATLDTDDNEKMNLQEILDDTGDSASFRGKCVKGSKEVDENDCGVLTVVEAIGIVDSRETRKAVRRAIWMADVNGDGMINNEGETDDILKQLGEALREMEESMRKLTWDRRNLCWQRCVPQSAWAQIQPKLRGSVEWCTDLTPLHSRTRAALLPDLLHALSHPPNALAFGSIRATK